MLTINFPLVKSSAFWHKLSMIEVKHEIKEIYHSQIIHKRNPYVVNMLPNKILAVNPLPTPLLSEVNIIKIWFPEDFSREGAEFPVSELKNSSLSLPPLYNCKSEFPS